MNHQGNPHLRSVVGKILYVASWSAAFVLAWQAVRFCQGHIGAPGFDQIISWFQVEPTPDAAIVGPNDPEYALYLYFGGIQQLLYYVGGVAVWMKLSQLALVAGLAASRIVEQGLEAGIKKTDNHVFS